MAKLTNVGATRPKSWNACKLHVFQMTDKSFNQPQTPSMNISVCQHLFQRLWLQLIVSKYHSRLQSNVNRRHSGVSCLYDRHTLIAFYWWCYYVAELTEVGCKESRSWATVFSLVWFLMCSSLVLAPVRLKVCARACAKYCLTIVHVYVYSCGLIIWIECCVYYSKTSKLCRLLCEGRLKTETAVWPEHIFCHNSATVRFREKSCNTTILKSTTSFLTVPSAAVC